MRVCDITREEEVVATVTLSIDKGNEEQDPTVRTIEVGPSALAAFEQGAWGAIQTLTPSALRVKDVKKQAAAKKAATSRAANAAAKASQKGTTPPVEPPAAPSDSGQGNAAAANAEPPAAPEKAVDPNDSGDPGF